MKLGGPDAWGGILVVTGCWFSIVGSRGNLMLAPSWSSPVAHNSLSRTPVSRAQAMASQGAEMDEIFEETLNRGSGPAQEEEVAPHCWFIDSYLAANTIAAIDPFGDTVGLYRFEEARKVWVPVSFDEFAWPVYAFIC